MIIIQCVIQVDNFFYVDKSFKLTQDKSKALIIQGKQKTKKMALLLEKHGIHKAKVIQLKM